MSGVKLVTDGTLWFHLEAAMIIEVGHDEYKRLKIVTDIKRINPDSIVRMTSTRPCPGCGDWAGPCQNASCVDTENDGRWC